MKNRTMEILCASVLCIFVLAACFAGCGVKNKAGKKTDEPIVTPTPEPVHKHAFGDWTVTKEPTCTEPGEWERSCPCGQVEKEILPARGHDFVDRVCTRCGEKLSGDATGLEFTLTEDGSGYVLSGAGTNKETMLIVPETYNGKPVVAVGKSAFEKNTYITEVVLQSGIRTIGEKAFSVCTSLRSIVLPEGLTDIGINAFSSCISLASVKLPESLRTIGTWGFYKCEALKEFEIPKGVESLAKGSLARMNGLEKFTVAEGNAKYHSAGNCIIETGAKKLVAGCRTSVIPDDGSVTELESFSFYFTFYDHPADFVVPAPVTVMRSEVFEYCKAMTSITLPDSLKTIGFAAFRHCESLTKLILPDGVETIDDEAFRGCFALTEIGLGHSLISLGNYVFGESGIKKVVLPKTVTEIKSCAFGSGANELEELIVEEGNPKFHSVDNCVIEIDSKTLVGGCKTSVIPADGSVTAIGKQAFSSCGKLPAITIPEGVTSIGESAFYHCASLATIDLPASLASVGKGAFSDCAALNTVNYAGSSEQWKAISFEVNNDQLIDAYKG